LQAPSKCQQLKQLLLDQLQNNSKQQATEGTCQVRHCIVTICYILPCLPARGFCGTTSVSNAATCSQPGVSRLGAAPPACSHSRVSCQAKEQCRLHHVADASAVWLHCWQQLSTEHSLCRAHMCNIGATCPVQRHDAALHVSQLC
jgi:hypothetical protein